MNESVHILEVEHLSVEYQDSTIFGKKSSFKALDDISFYVNQGEILGLVGESGCGKSTLSKAILGMLDTARVTGDIRHYTKRPQMVFQDPYGSLNPAKTIGWILEEPLRIFGKYDEAERKRRVIDMLEKVGLDKDYAKRKPSELSGGQRQRVAVARALANDPAVLLADEPTGNLDSKTSVQIMGLFQELYEQGKTVIVVTHEPDIDAYAKSHIVVKDGRILKYEV